MNKKDYFHPIVNHAKAAIFMLALIFTLAACPQVNLENPEGAMEKPSYTLSFNANGGSGSMNSITVKEGTIITLSSCPFTKSGMMFVAWNTSDDGFGTSYQNEASLIITKDITLFAQWAVPHTVTFNANGGTGTNYAQTVPENISTIIMENNFTKEGKILAYWNTESDGTGTTYLNARAATFDADVTLYAIWKTPCTVSFETNGGNILENQIVAEGNNANVPAAPKKDGYRFMGWFTDSELDSPFDFATPISEDTVLYASWKKILTLTYNANGGDGEIIEQTLLEGDEITLRENTFTRTDYGFACWNTSNDGSGDRYDARETITPTDSMTLYAQWGKTCTLTFSKNSDDAEGSMEEISAPAGSSVSLPASLFTRTGYYVSGWNTSADGSGTAYANGQTLVLNESQILYAQWREGSGNFYPVNLSTVEHGSVTLSTNSAMAGDFVNVTVEADENYTLSSISITGAAGNIPYVTITAGESYRFTMPDGNVSVDVRFILNQHQLSFASSESGAEDLPEAESVTKGEDFVLPAMTFIYKGTGYTFKNWNTESDGTGTSYNAGDSFTVDADSTLYAQWNAGYIVNGANLGNVLSKVTEKNLSSATIILTDSNATNLTGTSDSSVSTVAQALKANSTVNVSITFSGELKSFGNYAFCGCTNLVNITIPSSVTSIGEGAFQGCKNLKNIAIPSGVDAISKNCFKNCWNLESIDLANVKTIYGGAFNSCSSLSSINLGKIEHIYGDASFQYSGLTNVTIPATLLTDNLGTSATNYAFSYCQNLTTVTFNSKEIHHAMFYGCKNLTTVKLGTSCYLVGNEAFNECEKLSSVTFGCTGMGYGAIGDQAFSTCLALKSISIPSGFIQIGQYAFTGSGLTSATFDDSTSIWYKFSDNENIGAFSNPSNNAVKLTSTYDGYKLIKR